MNDLVLAERRRGMEFGERFVSVETSPRQIADGVEEREGVLEAVWVSGRRYKPTARFMKGLALRMKVPTSVFALFSPVEVVRRAAEVAPWLQKK